MNAVRTRPAPTRAGGPLPGGDPAAVLAAADRVAAAIAPRAAEHDRTGAFGHENVAALWEAGLGALTLPVALGGTGADLRTSTEAVARVAAADPSTALVWVMHLLQLRLLGVATDWPEALRAEIVADVLAGPALINALRVEPDLGTPARGGVPATRAVAVTDEAGRPAWRVRGHKVFSTGSVGLRWLAVWAATDAPGPAVAGAGPAPAGEPLAGTILVRADAPGVEIRETWDHLGLRASASHDVVLHDVVVPAHHAVGLAPVGADSPLRRGTFAAWTTALLAAVYVGVGRASRAALHAYLHERVPANLGAALATLPRLQAEAGEVEAAALVAETLVADLARDVDAGGAAAGRAAERAGLVKTVATRAVVDLTRRAVQSVGNAGLTRHNALQRHHRDALCGPVHTPQDDAVLVAAGRAALRGHGIARAGPEACT